ncbi:MAG: helix-turn-helix transcriptional regulator [Sporolactobacillus sp.]
MANKNRLALLFRASSLPDVLKTVRECSVNANVRTKATLSKEMGMTYTRMTGIESGTSRISLDEALRWCDICQDSLGRQMVLHIFGRARIPTDPRLVANLERQLVNFCEQAQQAITAASQLLKLTKDMRPGQGLADKDKQKIKELAGQIDDTHQAAECALQSIELNLSVTWAAVQNEWMCEAIVDRVGIAKMENFVAIEKAKVFG